MSTPLHYLHFLHFELMKMRIMQKMQQNVKEKARWYLHRAMPFKMQKCKKCKGVLSEISYYYLTRIAIRHFSRLPFLAETDTSLAVIRHSLAVFR